jgi:hypothetical protein
MAVKIDTLETVPPHVAIAAGLGSSTEKPTSISFALLASLRSSRSLYFSS